MTEDPGHATLDAAASPEAGEHGPPHLPPPSFIPINAAIALAVTFVGFLSDIRRVLGPAMWLVGLVWLALTCATWVRAARREYLELPEDAHH